MNRVCVFIDGSSFYFGLKRNSRLTRVDYYEFSKAIAGPDRELVKTFYYNAAYDPSLSPEQSKSQQPFLDSLAKTPFLEARFGRLISMPEGGFKEKGADVKMASDLVYYAAKNFFNTAIVITEDADFYSALSQLKEIGPHLEMAFFKDSQPKALMSAADRMIPLEAVLDKFASKIFPETEEDNIGNRIEDEPPKKRTGLKGGLKNSKADKAIIKTKS